MNRNDFMIGQVVYLKSITRNYNVWENERIVQGVVSKIGRKYIYVDVNQSAYRFNIDNDFRQETTYSVEYVLFLSKQPIYDYWQQAYLRASIGSLLVRKGPELKLRALKEACKALGIPIEMPQKDLLQ